ncbi:hypothetical protein DWF00_27215 [Bosea caraganae]|uniref:Uncharacterized protein n=1 Tax=Bosea caraganae TaxID=2763117 RepID=A0A370L9E5_9HYPH|nr:hypothetical protein DWF00_27215 [Bosea caraganae]RDJ27954.1 hypothetical protein DWE98_04940 [Bosea caraganae]
MDKCILARIRTAAHSGDRSAMSTALRELDRGQRASESLDDDPGRERSLVTLSLDDLIELIDLVARPRTFGEAMREEGVGPATGVRLATRQPHPRRRGPLPDPSRDD